MKNKKKHIDIYPTIFGLDLVVANKEVELKDLQNKYEYSNSDQLEDDDNCTASTSYCRDKSTGRYVVLVRYRRDSIVKGVDKKLDLINTASHEAIHSVMAIYHFVNEKVFPEDNNELLANLVGWAAECIYKTWTKR